MKIITKELLNEIYIKKYLIDQQNNDNYELIKNNINELIEEIYNVSKSAILPLTEKETYIYRKKYGILDNGIPNTYNSISKELNISHQRVEQIINLIEEKFSKYRINKIKTISYYDHKMSSIDNIDDINLKKLSIGDLNLDSLFNRTLYRNKIFTLADLLTFGYKDLKILLTNKQLLLLNNLLKKYNIKYIEELTLEEKRKIISNSELEKVNNSSICWLDISQENYLQLYQNNPNLLSIFNLIKKHNKESDLSNEIINAAKEIGFYIMKSDRKIEKTLDEILNKKIKYEPLRYKNIRILLKKKIITLKDLIEYSTKDIKKFTNMDDKSYNEIINLVHNYGLYFKDEKNKMELYTFEIYKNLTLEEKEDNYALKELLEIYRYLIDTKKELENRNNVINSRLSDVRKKILTITE